MRILSQFGINSRVLMRYFSIYNYILFSWLRLIHESMTGEMRNNNPSTSLVSLLDGKHLLKNESFDFSLLIFIFVVKRLNAFNLTSEFPFVLMSRTDHYRNLQDLVLTLKGCKASLKGLIGLFLPPVK